ncbi:hypothetical protein B4135_1189 [Caldibacillus debilis]|uniref:Uncharacterized protein n=1 Tax=Caldibacillus debilis TaxID=301148 RepID=A0A150ME19_9BACI|nr:hypothetical protein B4135_1189 [Caldibacillus debilis]
MIKKKEASVTEASFFLSGFSAALFLVNRSHPYPNCKSCRKCLPFFSPAV